jgi:hypothetical protein
VQGVDGSVADTGDDEPRHACRRVERHPECHSPAHREADDGRRVHRQVVKQRPHVVGKHGRRTHRRGKDGVARSVAPRIRRDDLKIVVNE